MSKLVILSDSREQNPYQFKCFDCEVKTASLATGDYSIEGLQKLISVERKELSDFISCCTSGRDRFKAELHRLQAYRAKAVIIEGSLEDIIQHRYRSQISPNSVIGSISSWTLRYSVPFIFAGDRPGGEMMCYSILSNFYRQTTEFYSKLNFNPQSHSATEKGA
jgi:ERCC4-type nuclease